MSENKKVRVYVSDTDFVKGVAQVLADNGGVLTARDLAAVLNITVATANSRAKTLRDAGIGIPDFSRKSKTIDVDGLNALLG
jgi:hypothetical protein